MARRAVQPEAAIEAAWRVVEPVLNEHSSAIVYGPGRWGPAADDHLSAVDGGWDNPELPPNLPAEPA